MSPDARAICAALFGLGAMGRPFSEHQPPYTPEQAARDVAALETALASLPPSDGERGIRGMVPVSYVKEILEGAIARFDGEEHRDDIKEYVYRRLQDVRAL